MKINPGSNCVRYQIKEIVLLFVFFSLLCTANAQSNSASHVNVDSLISVLSTSKVNAYTWSIKETNDWADLSTFLPNAKIAGITALVSLLPPSETPPINPTGNYSEPYQLDFITWVKEIAKLSLRYSNLTGYTIDNLQQNLSLGYIRQSYVDSMLSAGKSINPKLQFINNDLPKSYHLFYVDKNATGNGDGSNWTNAATKLSSLTWASIGSTVNDTVYISGGASGDTTLYSSDDLSGLSFPNVVVITRGKDTGHNGVVLYSSKVDSTTRYSLFNIGSSDNIKVTGLSFYWDSYNASGDNYIVAITDGSNNIQFDKNDIRTNGNMADVLVTNCYDISVTNNNVSSDFNGLTTNQDGIWAGNGLGNITITGNTILMRGTSNIPHIDGIQMAFSTGSHLITVADNFIMKKGQCIFLNDSYSSRYLIYNNVCVDTQTVGNGGAVMFVGQEPAGADTAHISAQIYNNTLISYGNTSLNYLLGIGYVDSLWVKNNIFYSVSGGRSAVFLSGDYYTYTYLNFDYNSYYQGNFTGGRIDTNYAADHPTFAEWQALGYDAHSDMGGVSFVNIWGSNFSDYKLTKGSSSINTGTPISLFNADIIGTLRPQGGGWDKGAFEQ